MKYYILMIITVAGSLLIQACGKSGGQLALETKPIPDNILPLIVYKTVGECADHSLRFQYLHGSGVQLWDDPEGPLTVAELDFFLDKRGTYQAIYREWDYHAGTKTYEQNLNGTFTYANGNLAISGIGAAVITINAGAVGINLTFTRELNTTGLTGKSLPMRMITHNKGLVTSGDYCTNAP